MDDYYGPGHSSGFGSAVMVVAMIALIVALALVAWLIASRAAAGRGRPVLPPTPPARSAREILDERLARGEIEPDDYHARLDALAGKRGAQDGG